MRLALAIAATASCDPSEFLHALCIGGLLRHPDIAIYIAHDRQFPMRGVPAEVTLCPQPDGTPLPRLWGAAIARAEATYIAVLDIRCPPALGWKEAALAEVDAGTQSFFGPVEPDFSIRDIRNVGYLIEYAQFHRPLSFRLLEVPGNNLVLRREFMGNSEVLKRDGFFKTFTLIRLARAGQPPPKPVEQMIVRYRKPFAFRRYCLQRFNHGRSFAARRLRAPGHPSKLLAIVFTPALPILRIWRIARWVSRIPQYRIALCKTVHLILAAETCWSAGELLGYLAGEGRSEELLE